MVSSVTSGAAPHGEAAAAAHDTEPASGYVATGSKPKSAVAKKKKPVVSGAEILQESETAHAPAKPAAGAHGAPAPAATSHDVPVARPAAAADAHAAAPVVAPPPAGGPAKLADVHERIAAALADARAQSKGAKADPHAGPEGAARPAARKQPAAHAAAENVSKAPRVTLAWPAPRWTVAWPDQPRIAVSWPVPATPAAVTAAPPAPAPAVPRQPQR